MRQIDDYFAASNEPVEELQRTLLEQSVTADVAAALRRSSNIG